MNNWNGVGRLTRDPEIRETNDGLTVAVFAVAIDRPNGGTDYPRIKCFGRTAENVGKYLTKGRQVAITGSVTTGKYQNRNGETVYTTEITANRVEFLGRGEATQEQQKPAQQQAGFVEIDPNDFPF